MAEQARDRLPSDGINGLKENWKTDMLSGFLVFLIALPLSLGISIASGFPPMAGLFTAMIGGIVVSVLSGSKLTIKGPAAGLIVIALGAITEFTEMARGHHPDWNDEQLKMLGYQFTLGVCVVSGLVQIVFGFIRAGIVSEIIPLAAVHGMLAAIGITIGAKQLHTVIGQKPISKETLGIIVELPHSFSHLNPYIAIIGAISLIIMFGMPMIKSGFMKKIPAPLVVLIVSIPLGYLFNLSDEHVYSLGGKSFEIGPKFMVKLPDSLLKAIVFPNFEGVFTGLGIKYLIMFALVGSIESLLSGKAIDLLDPYHRKSNLNRDLVAVGIGNTIAAFIGGLPMISEIVRSSANVNNGAKTRWANFFHGFFLLFFIVLFPFVIQRIPLSALAAMLIYAGYRLASPIEFKKTYDIGPEQLTIFLVTIVATLSTDLLVGIAAGIVVKLIIHIASGAGIKTLFKPMVKLDLKDSNRYHLLISKSAIFSNYLGIKKHLDNIPKGQEIVFDFKGCTLVDHTVMEQLHRFEHDYERTGGKVFWEHLDDLKPYSKHPLASRKKG